MHYLGKRLAFCKLAVAGLWAFCPGNPVNAEEHVVLLDTESVHLAQSAAPAVTLRPWSERSDVREGAGLRGSGSDGSQGVAVKSEAMPEDVRRSSTPRADAIPLFQRSGRSELEDIRYGSRPEHTSSSGDSIITLQPFSDGDVRQGSRRQQGLAPQTGTVAVQPVPAQQEKKSGKGYFGRVLEKIGF